MYNQQQKEDYILIKRFQDLADFAEYGHEPVYSDFLSLAQQQLFYDHVMISLGEISYELWGGYAQSERKILCLYRSSQKDSWNPKPAPLCCIKIAAAQTKFSDNMTHRDFLGALLHLGIDRCLLGDILIEDNIGYVFAVEHIAGFIIDNLLRVRHTSIRCTLSDKTDSVHQPEFRIQQGTVSSLRLDAVIAMALKLSRTQAVHLVESESVFVNGRLVISNSHILKDDDVISVRKHGKFIIKTTDKKSKKDKYVINAHIFV